MQELMLSDFLPISTGSVDGLSDDEFAQVTPTGYQ